MPVNPKRTQGVTAVEIIVAICILIFVTFIVSINVVTARIRSKTSRVRADLRLLATGLEAYYVDIGIYPAWVCGGNGVCSVDWMTSSELGSANGFAGKKAGAARIHTFRVQTANRITDPGNRFFSLTTPISYIPSFIRDPFADTAGATYGYYAQKSGWIVYSFGPDKDENDEFAGDLDPYVEATLLPTYRDRYGEIVYDYRVAQSFLFLLTMDGKSVTGLNYGGGSFTYDPTNGINSEGDIWRTKQ